MKPLHEPFYNLIHATADDTEGETTAVRELAPVIHTAQGDHGLLAHLVEGLVASTVICHGLALRAGWWTDPVTGEPKDRNDGECIALMHSELSEMLEGLRKDKQDDHLPHRKSAEVELADLLIRAFDYAGARNLDVAGAVIEKLAYNLKRQDHQLSARAAAGGKKF